MFLLHRTQNVHDDMSSKTSPPLRVQHVLQQYDSAVPQLGVALGDGANTSRVRPAPLGRH